MLDKIKKLKLKKPISKTEGLTPQELLFKHWHRILLGYAVCNVIFIILSVAMVSGITTRSNTLEEIDMSSDLFTREGLLQSIELQRYKTLVKQGLITIPETINLD